jgi:hypothetical protein
MKVSIREIQAELREFNQHYLAVKYNKDIPVCYPNLVDNSGIKYTGLCGTASDIFQKILTKKYKIKSEYIGIYHIPVISYISNQEILDDWDYDTGYINDLQFGEILLNPRNTHVVLEINCGNFKRIIDPMNGIVYPCGKEQLLRGIYKPSREEISYLRSSIHCDHSTYYYLTMKFWESVYYLNYNNGQGIDITQYGKYNKYAEDICW